MAQFLKYVLATLVGLFLASVIFVLLLGALVGGLTRSMDTGERIKPNSVLFVNLNYPMAEQTRDNFWENVGPDGRIGSPRPGLNEVLAAIEEAANDDDIKGIRLQLGVNPNGYSRLDELRSELVRFKEAGKFVIADGQYISQRSYYLAAVADEIYLRPGGMIDLKGFSAGMAFYTGLLDKVGIEPEVFYAGDYKSATEPFRLEGMSDANREQIREFIGDYHERMMNALSQDRGISREMLESTANGLLAWEPGNALDIGLVDDLMYEDEVLDRMRERVGLSDSRKLPSVSLGAYIDQRLTKDDTEKAEMAIIYAEGDIVDGSGDETNIGARRFVPLIRKARKNDDIKAIVLRVNSPGGSAPASDLIWREVKLAAEEKTVVVSMGDVAASGGYFIAAPADRIVAQPFTVTGSIGVFFIVPRIDGLMTDHLGVTFDREMTADMADFPNINREFTEAERSLLQSMVDTTYLDFKRKVAEGRPQLDLDGVEAIAKGRIWTGVQAERLGLVDELGGIDRAVELAAELANLESYSIVELPEQEENIWMDLARSMSQADAGSLSKDLHSATEAHRNTALAEELGPLYAPLTAIKNAASLRGLQARMSVEFLMP